VKHFVSILTAILLMMSGANAATNDEKRDCLQYDKQPVTLTGTVLMRKIDSDDAAPGSRVPFPLLVLDQPICTWGPDVESEVLEWSLQLSDKCARVWPAVSHVKVTGILVHAFNWHHHTKVLIAAEQIARLDGRLPACTQARRR
jgi:hypothetical protein